MIPQEMVLEDGRKLVLIHYIYRSPRGTTGMTGQPLTTNDDTWKLACAPNLLEFGTRSTRSCPHQRTDDPRAVTCPLCKKTEAWQRAFNYLRSQGAAR